MSEYTESTNKKVMIIVAHPDDADFMAAGTLAKWAKEGCSIVYLLCTSGDKGTSDPNMKPESLAVIRESEQENACRVVGGEQVIFLRHADGMLQNTLALRKDIVRQIRIHQPDVVICQDPTNRYGDSNINHPDHRAAGDTALDAIFPSARDYHMFPELVQDEGLLPHKVLEVYLSTRESNASVWIDITDTIDIKVSALKQHASQVGTDAESLERLETRLKQRASDVGTPHAIKYAEAFKYIRLR